jgi:hypothetical protein
MKCNLSPVDRVIRCAGGALLAVLGLFAVRGWLGILLALLGAVFVFSGTVGFCHIYKVLHISTSKKG